MTSNCGARIRETAMSKPPKDWNPNQPSSIKKKLQRTYCKWCGEPFIGSFVIIHEAVCPVQGPLFNSLGKTFRIKPTRPDPEPPPDIRVASITYTNGRMYPILLDDILLLFSDHFDRIQRCGRYRSTEGIDIFCFRLLPYPTVTDGEVDLHDAIWDAVKKALKAGAKL
jgi:hypothetical protein